MRCIDRPIEIAKKAGHACGVCEASTSEYELKLGSLVLQACSGCLHALRNLLSFLRPSSGRVS